MHPSPSVFRDRRRRDLRGRVARATYPMRRAVGSFVDDFPCNVIGHHWVEIPRRLLRARMADEKKLAFRCSRCNRTANFTN